MIRHKKIALFATLSVCVTLCIVAAPHIWKHRYAIIQHPMVERLMPLYHSLRKIPDILFLPYSLFAKSNLETYTLSIDPKDIQKMNSALSENPFGDATMTDDQKVWVSAHFTSIDYSDDVKVRYRGNRAIHWNGYKKSYLIKFPKDHLFHGMRELALIIPSSRNYFAESLNHARARLLGLLVPDEYYISLHLNGINRGMYFAMETWSQEWLEKYPVSANSVILGINTGNATSTSAPISAYSKEGLAYWKSWNNPEYSMDAIKSVIEILDHADDDTFAKLIPHIVDIQDYCARDVLSILAGSYHSADALVQTSSNLILLFDATDGLLKPLPYNTAMDDAKEMLVHVTNKLRDRIFSIPAFKDQRDRMLHAYVEEHQDEDLTFIADWMDKNLPNVYTDTAKSVNTFQALNTIRELKKNVEQNIVFAQDGFDEKIPPVNKDVRDLKLPGSFSYLLEAIQTKDVFVQKHPEFRKTEGGLVLPRGTHVFHETIVIPQDAPLTIDPGAILRMGPGASVISYSPVTARGTSDLPIRIQPTYASNPWGVFMVINTQEDMSVFDYTEFDSGSEDLVNDIPITGMLALHKANGEILHSTFKNAQGDDGVNVKGGRVLLSDNRFEHNYSDGIDADYVHPDTVIERNLFLQNGGDGIDLSWSDINIRNNVIIASLDKGVSVGERSFPNITNNIIVDCTIGIATKDQSRTNIHENTLIRNQTAFSAYQKKAWFGGGEAILTENTLWENKNEISQDSFSTLNVSRTLYSHPSIYDDIPDAWARELQAYTDVFANSELQAPNAK